MFSGARSEGVVYGAVMFAQKLTVGVTGWGFGLWLSALDYGSAGAASDASNLGALLFFIAAIPSVLLVIGSFLVWFFPLDRHSHADIVGQLQSKGGSESGFETGGP